jgi:hypothetical protein
VVLGSLLEKERVLRLPSCIELWLGDIFCRGNRLGDAVNGLAKDTVLSVLSGRHVRGLCGSVELVSGNSLAVVRRKTSGRKAVSLSPVYVVGR